MSSGCFCGASIAAGESDMQRLIFTLVSAHSGWQLYEGDQGRLWFASRNDAVETADLMATSLHENHGIPTAVVMDMAGRESVMLVCHG
ncbi:MAG TPA: hypothetical protein VF471_06490 [Pseudoxanthomonas sp.]